MQKVLFTSECMHFMDDNFFTETEVKLLAKMLYEESGNHVDSRLDDYHFRGLGDSFSYVKGPEDKLIVMTTNEARSKDIYTGAEYVRRYADKEPLYVRYGGNWLKVRPAEINQL